jgi:hypothetical protein
MLVLLFACTAEPDLRDTNSDINSGEVPAAPVEGCQGHEVHEPMKLDDVDEEYGWYVVEGPSEIEAELATLPPCEPREANGRLDLLRCSVDGIRPGQAEEEVRDQLGPPYYCEPGEGGEEEYCAWAEGGLEMTFRNERVWGGPQIFYSYDATTLAGTGTYTSPLCAVDELGPPDWMLRNRLTTTASENLTWWDPAIRVSFHLGGIWSITVRYEGQGH